ncbi:Uncharacterised protein [Paenibacillus thiaminolyticus]|nr:Uncharacterised protein [Paenibacillus thiaminolyticus]
MLKITEFNEKKDSMYIVTPWGIPWGIYISSEMQLDSEKSFINNAKNISSKSLYQLKLKK